MEIIAIIIPLILFFALMYALSFLLGGPRERVYLLRPFSSRKRLEWEKIMKKSENSFEQQMEQKTTKKLDYFCKKKFGVSLDSIHESHSQDEIVRIVNLLAYFTAEACVNQDKKNRNVKVSSLDTHKYHYYFSPSGYFPDDWDEAAHDCKLTWSEYRKFALQVLPELESRLPHFSQVEPLKSYNKEYLLRKKAEK